MSVTLRGGALGVHRGGVTLVAELWRCTRGRGWVGAMAPASLSSGFQSFTPLPTIKLGHSGAGSRVSGPVHALGPCGSLQGTLLWGLEFLCCHLNPHGCFHSEVWGFTSPRWSPGLRGLLRCPPFVRFICGWMWCCRVLPATLPAPLSATLSPALWVYLCKCGTAGSASAWTACAICPTLRQSWSCHGHASPLHPVPVSAPPTGLDECLFSISLVLVPLAVRFSVSSDCARRRSVSTYAAILVLLFFTFLSKPFPSAGIILRITSGPWVHPQYCLSLSLQPPPQLVPSFLPPSCEGVPSPLRFFFNFAWNPLLTPFPFLSAVKFLLML